MTDLHDYVTARRGSTHGSAALTAELMDRDRWPASERARYQSDRLRAAIKHAVTHSPYYRDVIGDIGNGSVALHELPILTKKMLMTEFDRIVTDRRLRLMDVERHLTCEFASETLLGKYRVFSSGGTTGYRGVAVYDTYAWQVAVASLRRVLSMQGVSAGTRVTGIGSPSVLHATNRLFAALRGADAGGPRLSVTTPMAEIVAALNEFQPQALITYPSFIRRLAEEQAAGRLRIAPENFCSAAETLTQDVRDLANETWGASVLNAYGATEVNIIGAECTHKTGLHVAEDLIVLEVVDRSNAPVAPGVAGHKVLVTTLFNRTLPLIRYELSDLVTIADGACPCGRDGLRLAGIEGRREDVLNLPARGGGQLAVHAVHLQVPLLRLPSVRQFQVASQAGGLLIRVALDESAAADEVIAKVRSTIRSELDRIGAVVDELMIERVKEIERTGTGAKEKLVRVRSVSDPKGLASA